MLPVKRRRLGQKVMRMERQVMGRGQRWVKMGLRVETRLCTWYCQKMRRERMNRRDSGKWNVVESVSLLEEVF